jgi:ANTAR domain-containing protein
MDSREGLSMPVAESAPGQPGVAHGIHLRAGACDRQLRAAALAVAISESRLKTEELRARYARVVRKLTAAEESIAAAASRLAEVLPHHAERLLALSAEAEAAAREWHRAAGGDGHGSGTTVAPGAAGPLRAGAPSAAATRRRSEALAQCLEQASAAARATIAQVREGRPQREILNHSVMARLRARLDTMPVIEQAKGIIMARSQCGPDEAFDLLRRTSQRLNVPVRELAGQIVAKTGRAAARPGQDGGKAHPHPPRRAMPANDRPDRPTGGNVD